MKLLGGGVLGAAKGLVVRFVTLEEPGAASRCGRCCRRPTAKALAARPDGNYAARRGSWGGAAVKRARVGPHQRAGAWPRLDGPWGLAALCRMTGELR